MIKFIGYLFLFLQTTLCSTQLLAKDSRDRDTKEKELTDAIFPRTDPKTIGLIYQMLKVIDILFTEHDIPYWIDGGTALGAIRHQGCIPWDDDADLVYHFRDETRILALADEFANFGFHIEKEQIIRLYPIGKSHPFIDLAGYSLCSDNTFRFELLWARKYYPNFFWLPNEIDILIKVPFGPLMLSAPNDMIRYLLMGYGEDCLSYAVFQTHHGGEKCDIKIREKVKIVDFSPAKYEIENLQILLD